MDGKTFELKVGIFVLIGIILLFIIVFSIGDIYLVKSGYQIYVSFHFASGVGQSSPVRFAGVDVGQVEKIHLYYDKEEKKTKALVTAWIRGDTKIEKDAKITINTLGLLGEKYLEISPGTIESGYLEDGAHVLGHDPVSMEEVTESLKEITDSVLVITDRLRKGEGTIGKLLTEESVYTDLRGISGSAATVLGRLEKGEGTIGKLLREEKIYNDLEAFVEDIKKHPWKLLSKPRTTRQRNTDTNRGGRR